jgi:hypothetical protein
MNDMDLVPSEFRKGLTLRRNLRRFTWTLVLLLVLVAGARATLGYLIWREQSQVVSLEQQQQALSHTLNETESLRQQRLVTQEQLATLDQLQGADLVEQFLHSVDEAYIDQVWLDSVHLQRRDNPAADANAANSAASGAPAGQTGATGMNVLHDAEIVGHASNHSDLALFMQRLGAQPAVADLRLINTATRSYTSVQVIDFRLALQLRSKERP